MDTGTLSGVVFDDSADAGNSPFTTEGAGPGTGDGSAAPVEGQGQPASSAYEARLADLERTNQRHREQMAGSQQEVQRLLESNRLLSQQNTEFLTAFRDLLKTPTPPGANGAGSPPAAEPIPAQNIGLVKALEKGVLEGDWSDAQRLEAQLPAILATLAPRQAPAGETLRPEQIQDLVRAEMTRTTTQQETYRRMVTSMAQSHPFLADPKDPLYAEVWQAYDESAKHPFLQTAYGEGGERFTVDMPAPAGKGWTSKPMDMRILDRVALEVRSRHATANGRRQAEERRDSPTLDATGRQPPSARTPSMLFTRGEMANMQELLRLGIRGVKTMEEFKKYRWEKLIAPEEKQRRLEVWRAGKWE